MATQELEQKITAETEAQKQPPQAGDIFYASWGYDQTNINYCQIIEVSKTGKTVKCRMLPQKEINYQTVAPITEPFGIVFQLKVKQFKEDQVYYLKGSYPYCQGEDVYAEGEEQLEGKRWGYDTRLDCLWKYRYPNYQTPALEGH
jgi:hypothetical protein